VVLFNGSTGKLIKDGGYIAESTSNKENTIINTSTTKYPTVNLLNT
jgi:nucleoside recognition membrane protein YjiH